MSSTSTIFRRATSRIVGKEDAQLMFRLDPFDVTDHRLAEGIGQYLLDIEDGYQRTVWQFGDRGDERALVGEHALGGMHLVPIDADDAIDILAPENPECDG